MLFLTQTILDQLTRNAIASSTEECCGFLLGWENDHHRVISSILIVENIAWNREKHFKISARDYLKAEKLAIQNNLQLLGVYHSHPNCRATPSEADRLMALPNFSYLIMSVIDGKIEETRAWSLNADLQFDEEVLSFININPVHGNSNYSNTAA
jgi:proteasome lid subunit RPN8/RPN11